MSIEIIDKILKEDNKLQDILIPSVNNQIESKVEGTFIFKNKETFQGKIIKSNNQIVLLKGKYTWPNGQIYYGDLYPNNLFIKKGKIIFPDNSELFGKFDGENNIIEKAIYKTNSRIYQGSFKKNKLHGKFIIKNKDEYPYYLYKGNYYNGAKHGKFSLEKMYNHEKIKITGNYNEGIKYGEFKIFKIKEDKEELIDGIKFDGDCPIFKPKEEELIENKVLKFFESNYKINCMKIINDKLLLGSYENLIIYDINNKDNDIIFNRKILLFKNEDINDFLETKYKKILLCSSNNNFKLIELTLDEKNNSYLNTTISSNLDFHLLQEFKGLENSKSIFCIIELSNEMVISGDCENIILWDYINLSNNKEKNNIYEEDNKSKENSFFGKILGLFIDFEEKKEKNIIISEPNSLIQFYEYNIIQNEKLHHINSIVEIKHKNNEVIIGVAEPDSKSVFFIKIEDKKKMYKFNKIECHDEITMKKNIMKYFDNKLFVGCKNKLIVIDINKYEIIYNIFSESITYINIFLDKYIICCIARKINRFYEYEGYLLQKNILKNPKSEQIKIINISSFTKYKHKGIIVDTCIYNQKSIITAETNDTNGKILILN